MVEVFRKCFFGKIWAGFSVCFGLFCIMIKSMQNRGLFKKIFLGVGLLFVAFLIFVFIRELTPILAAIREAKWYWLVAAVLLQVATYVFLALLFYDIFLFFGYKIIFLRLFKVSFSLNYLNQTLPSFGLSGLYFMLLVLKKDGVSAGKSIIAGILYYIFIHFTFLFLLIYAFTQLFLKEQLNRLEILATLASIALALLLVFVSIYLFRRKKLFKKILRWFIWPLRRFILPFSKNQLDREELDKFLNVDFLIEELARNIGVLNHAKMRMLWAMVYSFLIHLFDAATLYVLFLAFNFKVSFSVAIIGFVFGSLFAFVSLIPAGIGVEEVSRGLIMAGFGVPLGIAMLASVVFRALTFWFNIPLGIFAYKDLMKSLEE